MILPHRCFFALSAFVIVVYAFGIGVAHAQLGTELSESTLKAPWERHLAVLKSLAETIKSLEDEKTRGDVADALFYLESGISEYEAQTGEVINRLAGDPQFSYVAGETSAEMGDVIDRIYKQFETLYAALEVTEREDVLAAQQALGDLRSLLKKKRPFEVDVVNALGSGIPQIIIGLAERWWHGEEQAALTREYISALRQQIS